ncbi:something about silencing, SAS, complex subunit 4-domain-containing protein [Staphylotrichum tortipilum]|uniref:Something about silencing, SAS, complex subunit 4-domain-containing protein n=1 Tax=Staphylotrichum tortipilum TaxID=2831512 RepID=A0AAN6RTX3_9PEZI|nr:something about silencing, SAS, complex subunit 4-domain-containing protein [Staphylotrichum longicolle]
MAMTASMTRSRRAEGVHVAHPRIASGHHRLVAAAAAAAAAVNANAKSGGSHQHLYHAAAPSAAAAPAPAAPAPRPKRQLDVSAHDLDAAAAAAKRAKFTTGIAVEIPARPSLHTRFSRESLSRDSSDAKSKAQPPPTTQVPLPQPPRKPAPNRRGRPASGPKPAAAANTTTVQKPTRTKHQEKVANGLKHELDRLQPAAPAAEATKDQGRKLRSQEATRFKSELSAYFPEYDEVIGNDPKETHLLNVDTPIIITRGDPAGPDSSNTSSSSTQYPRHHQLHHHPPPAAPPEYPIRSYSDALFTDLFDAQRIDFSFLNKPPPDSLPHHRNNNLTPKIPDADPLPPSSFEPAHKKAERLERSIRNSEKGRAQHEKDQIIRLLDGLQGHDWLRVMGVSGITESRKRAFEPAREHFVRGCEGILAKFRRWATEEKRRKVERGGSGAGVEKKVGREEEEEGEEEEGGVGSGSEDEGGEKSADDLEDGDPEEESEPPDNDDDVDASIAKQLREEALAAARKKTAKRKPPPPSHPQPPQEPPPSPIRSFFAKRYQRDAALARSRRKGRNVMAWGRPVPEVAEAEFGLPEGFVDEEIMRVRARGKRRDMRGRARG